MYGNAGSSMLLVEYGKPQRSLDTPYLFINDIARSSCAIKFVIFAVTCTSIFDNNLCNFSERTGNVLSDINAWLKANRLTLNESKTTLIVSFRK